MGESGYLAAFIAVAAVATFATRVIPFLFFERHTEHPLIALVTAVLLFEYRKHRGQAPGEESSHG